MTNVLPNPIVSEDFGRTLSTPAVQRNFDALELLGRTFLTKPIDLNDTPGSDPLFRARTTGDTNPRWEVRADGSMLWGPGNAALDTTLSRVAAKHLRVQNVLSILQESASAEGLTQLISGDANNWLRSIGRKLHMGDGTSVVDVEFGRVAANVLGLGANDNLAVPNIVTGSSLGTGTDGEIKFYTADGTNGVIWMFRYRSASAASSKWEFVGGAPLHGAQSAGASQSTANVTTWAAMTNGPTVTLPLAGDYDITISGAIQQDTSSATDGRVAIGINGTANTIFLWHVGNSQFEGGVYSATVRMTAFSASDALTMRVATNNLGVTFGAPVLCRMSVVPVRVT